MMVIDDGAGGGGDLSASSHFPGVASCDCSPALRDCSLSTEGASRLSTSEAAPYPGWIDGG